ncbi:ATPase family AAA domain-containing protein 2-like isoform X1 [Gambusia affinis]|uniref:ATPase family AAA domain-containing protein 2-like isoform X1 n=1 Tax=Gambusia affinis TaxID=33528 RepID=UPI001CDD4CD1|nr:ATPase family AAA domain-containing protein 2-like isoform X1 [Gambusia affinis]XP_043995278.1 ATPase family AAA domain-containing protein 2-like isoform X1 [Gambusia affinis]
MVKNRGRANRRRDVVRNRKLKKKAAKVSKTPQRARKDTSIRTAVTRSKTKKLPKKVPAKKEEENRTNSHTRDEEIARKPARKVIRRSSRLKNLTRGKKYGIRKSTRRTTQTTTYEASKKFNAINSNHGDQKDITNQKKKKQLIKNKKNEKIPSKEQKTITPEPPQKDLIDTTDDIVDDVDSGVGTTADEESNCSVTENFDAINGKPSSPYQGAKRGNFQVNSSGKSITRRRTFRAAQNAWSTDNTDSDDEKASSSNCRVLGLRKEELFSSRREKLAMGAGLADIDPMAIDRMVGFDSIGGLSGHISALKEMVVFPLLYPEVFDNFKIQPPRGCLFYGPPGTGKTLVARALANECSHGNEKVSFFMRKGADCLSKWVGESERQLRLLFEQAYQRRPSIIFFDEIDGLAPVRSSKQDQIHSSIVSTLLALMDGLDGRGEIVVIGATNRLDSIDPALRRPGRFDREFLFALPDKESRKEILKIHTRLWKPPPSEDFLDELAGKCVGYCGADIRAVCTEAALCALRRRYPQIYGTSQKLLLDVSSISVSSCDFVAAMRKMKPASQRSNACPTKPLSAVVQPLLRSALSHILEVLQKLFPHAEQGMKRKREPGLTSGIVDDGLMSSGDEGTSTCSISAPSTSQNKKFLHFARSAVKHPTSHRPRMLLAGRSDSGQTSHLAPAILHALERFTVHSLDSAVLFGVSWVSPEEACAQVFCEAKRTSPSILYIPHIQQWWDTAGSALRASFLSLLGSIPSFSPILLLATCSVPHQKLDTEIQTLFREEYGEIYTMTVPSRQERTEFFEDLILNQAAEAPPSKNKLMTQNMEILPVAPLPPLRQMTEQERLRVEEQEEDVLRELRLFLRNLTERLIVDRRFKAFTKPVDIEEVPDYLMVIQKPMDLSTLLYNIDEHKYVTVDEFMSDADLIWQNALEYNPDRDPADRHIRHRACALKDTMRVIIRDELDKDFQRICEEIRESRLERALSHRGRANLELTNGFYNSVFPRNSTGPQLRKKKSFKSSRKSKWSTGVIRKRQQKKTASSSSMSSITSSDSSTDGMGGESSSVGQSSSSLSDSSDGDENIFLKLNRHHQDFKALQKRLKQRCNESSSSTPKIKLKSSQPSKSDPIRRKSLTEFYLKKLERQRKSEMRTNKAVFEQMQQFNKNRSAESVDEQTPDLVVDHKKLKELLNRAIVKTEAAEVETLEKFYALLAQSIYRHRNNYNKTELLKEMKKEIENFS